jgi:hypothetical protein
MYPTLIDEFARCGFMSDDSQRDAYDWLPLDTARTAFALLVAGPQPLSIDGRRFPALPNRKIPLDELRDRLLGRGFPRHARDAVWRHLIARARAEGAAWTVGCAGVALPVLATTARWLADRYRGDRADAHAVVLAGFVDAISTVRLDGPGVFPRLRWAMRRASQTALEESLDAPTPMAPGFRSAVPRAPWGHPDLVLARAVEVGVVTRIEADLVGATRLEQVPVPEWARVHGVVPKTAYNRRAKAEKRLVAHLADAWRDLDPDDPMSSALVAAAAPASRRIDAPARRQTRSVHKNHQRPKASGGQKSSRSVRKTGPESGLLKRGANPPSTPASPPEEPRCA